MAKTRKQRETAQRAVDSLNRLFAVVVALSITIAIQRFLFGSAKLHDLKDLALQPHLLRDLFSRLPQLLAFIATMVPFYQGMDRHMNVVYVDGAVSKQHEGFLVVDFFVFFFESCLLVAFASLVNSGGYAFVVLMLLLGTDVVWCFLARAIHYKKIEKIVLHWGLINIVTVVLLLVCYHSNLFPQGTARIWAMCVVAVGRTGFDYWICWRFYIPE